MEEEMGELQLKVKDLYEPGHTLAWPYLEKVTYPWEILKSIKDIILAIGPTLDPEKYDNPSEGVWVAKSAKVFPSAYLGSPCIIGEDTEVRQCAFIRGSALVGNGCVVGNSVELKNVIISDNVQVPHYNYVGDSVLGYKSHMGAGSITSNVKSDKTLVIVKADGDKIETGLKKFGAMLGDFVEVGCNSVLNPGTVIGSHSNVYPTSSVRGVIPAHSIFKSGKGTEIVSKEE
jgi:NDP-sugar pyrophosphorylase family protein